MAATWSAWPGMPSSRSAAAAGASLRHQPRMPRSWPNVTMIVPGAPARSWAASATDSGAVAACDETSAVADDDADGPGTDSGVVTPSGAAEEPASRKSTASGNEACSGESASSGNEAAADSGRNTGAEDAACGLPGALGGSADSGAPVAGPDPRGHGDQASLARGSSFTGITSGRADARAGTRTCAEGGTTGSGAGATTAGEAALPATNGGRASATFVPAACGAGAPGRARAGAFFGRTFGGCACHTRADTTISSFSAKGAIRHQARGSAMYRT